MADPPIVRSYEAGMSVEALASAWARRESAPEGAVVVLRTEVSGRLRGGEPWTLGGDESLIMAMVARPEIDPLQEAMLWLPASLAAADSLTAATGTQQALVWPDRVADRVMGAPWCAINVSTQLGPGRVEHAVFSMRLDLRDHPGSADVGADPDALVGPYVSSARDHLRLLRDDPSGLLDAYTERCDLIGERVRVGLLPRGEARGRVAAIDADGFLVLESSTGMLERVAPATLKTLDVVADGA